MTARKTLEELENEILLNRKLKEERDVSNDIYAPMIVKTIVFGMVSLILTGVFIAIIALVVKS